MYNEKAYGWLYTELFYAINPTLTVSIVFAILLSLHLNTCIYVPLSLLWLVSPSRCKWCTEKLGYSIGKPHTKCLNFIACQCGMQMKLICFRA